MKLWHIAQWGNPDDGGNGPDTNCIVRANNLSSAIKIAENAFGSPYRPSWREGKADVVYLMGEDSSDKTDERVVIQVWVAHTFNFPHYKGWGRDYTTDEWESHDILYPS
jgi:hypothetical protein